MMTLNHGSRGGDLARRMALDGALNGDTLNRRQPHSRSEAVSFETLAEFILSLPKGSLLRSTASDAASLRRAGSPGPSRRAR
jgi:hypothetical protein